MGSSGRWFGVWPAAIPCREPRPAGDGFAGAQEVRDLSASGMGDGLQMADRAGVLPGVAPERLVWRRLSADPCGGWHCATALSLVCVMGAGSAGHLCGAIVLRRSAEPCGGRHLPEGAGSPRWVTGDTACQRAVGDKTDAKPGHADES
jgi:hypothetical protein